MSVCAICLREIAEEDEAFVEGCLHRFCLSVKVSLLIQIVEVPCAPERLMSFECRGEHSMTPSYCICSRTHARYTTPSTRQTAGIWTMINRLLAWS